MSELAETRPQPGNIPANDVIRATLNYVAASSEKLVIYTYEPPTAIPRATGTPDPEAVLIHNARLQPNLSLDEQGFQLVHHETAVRDFYDRNEVEKVYYPEIEVLLKQTLGVEKVVVFDHQVRNIQLSQRSEKNARDYVWAVHNDYTAKSGPRRVRDHLSAAEAEQRLGSRFAELNVWRPIRGPIESTPLALCDAKSIEPKDFVPTDFVYRDKVGEVYRFKYNPNHRWYYFPRLERNEAILLKCFDSKEDGRARFSAHTAFNDPNTLPGAAPRESIEVRALVFWANQ